MDDAENHAVFDVSTIANYDPSITPFLDSPSGNAFEKLPDQDSFRPVTDWKPSDEA